jgi:hypothetical protein
VCAVEPVACVVDVSVGVVTSGWWWCWAPVRGCFGCVVVRASCCVVPSGPGCFGVGFESGGGLWYRVVRLSVGQILFVPSDVCHCFCAGKDCWLATGCKPGAGGGQYCRPGQHIVAIPYRTGLVCFRRVLVLMMVGLCFSQVTVLWPAPSVPRGVSCVCGCAVGWRWRSGS